MPLTRLDNLISSKTGKYLYVSPDDFNATDALDNRGNSPLRPFVSIQRAFLEAARFSYLPNVDNDRFDQFTIMLAPGNHYIDNRPGVEDVSSLPIFQFNQASQEWEANTNVSFDLSDPDNILYKFNGRDGGATIPRGTSLVGTDLRRTQVRALYVPDPADKDIPRTALFNVTGGCYFWQFTILDGDLESSSPLYNVGSPVGVGKVYTQPNDNTNLAIPEFSHHKITNFVFADREDLGLLYRKIARVFSDYQPSIDDVYVEGSSSPVTESWNSTTTYQIGDRVLFDGNAYVASAVSTNIEPDTDEIKWGRLVIRGREFEFRVQENRIVGPLSDAVRLDEITITDSNPTGIVTAKVRTKINHGFFPGQYVAISNNGLNTALNGVFKVTAISQTDPKEFEYKIATTATGLGLISGATYTVVTSPALDTNSTVQAEVDSVESASPYVFNVSIRSTWGICGIWADGRKATGFKSMVIAQYTGVSLQKDDRAFIRYDEFSNTWNQAPLTDAFATTPYHIKGDAYWKDDWRNFHVRASDDSFIQNVSIFAVGFADHFLLESGGDMSITNSNSNFGNTSMHSVGYKGFAFSQDKGGYITHIVPPKSLSTLITSRQQYYSFDVQLTRDANNFTKLYLGSEDATNPESRPAASIGGYRIGARRNEKIFVKLDTSAPKQAELSPSGFKKWVASLSTLTPSSSRSVEDATTLYVASTTGILVNDLVRVDDEYFLVSAKTATSLTVSRSQIGSSPSQHLNSSTVTRYVQNTQVSTVVNETVDASETILTLTSATGFIPNGFAQISNNQTSVTEIVRVVSVENNDIVVQRGALGTVAVQQPVGSTVTATFLSNTYSVASPSVTTTLTEAYPRVIPASNASERDYNLAQDAANLIDANKTFIQSEAFGYVLEKYPYLQNIPYVNPNITAETGRYRDGSNLIKANRQEIIDYAFGQMQVAFPTFTVPGGTGANEKCKRDIGYIVDAIADDLYDGGNAHMIEATKAYFDSNGALITNGVLGEQTQSIFAFNRARDWAKKAISNLLTETSLLPVSSITSTGTTVTVTTTENHGLQEGDKVTVGGATQTAYNGKVTVLAAGLTANQFRYTAASAPSASPATGAYYVSTVTIDPVNDDPEVGRFKDARNLINANRQEIIDRAFAEIAIQYDESAWGTNWIVPGDTVTTNISRYFDAYRLVQKNKQIIIETAYATVVASPPSPAPTDLLSKCKRDIGYFVDAISLDLLLGSVSSSNGNKYTRKFLQQYFNGAGTALITNGLAGEVSQSNTAFNKARDAINAAITNTLGSFAGVVTSSPAGGTWQDGTTGTKTVYTDLTISAGPATYGGGGGNIANNNAAACSDVQSAVTSLTLLVTSTLTAGTLSGLPAESNGLTEGSGQLKCMRDIGYIVDSVAQDLFWGGNEFTVTAVREYFTLSGTPISNGLVGETTQSVVAFNAARDMVKKAITNQLYAKNLSISAGPAIAGGSGGNIPVDQSGNAASCADVQTAVTNLFAIVTDVITAGTLNNLPAVDNGEYDCANVRNTIDTLTAIITTSLNSGNLQGLPAENPGQWSQISEASKCKRDIGYIVEALTSDLRLGGNENTINAAEAYYTAVPLVSDTLDGNQDGYTLDYIENERQETLDAYNYVRNLAISAMRNHNTYINNASITNGSPVVTVASTIGLAIGMRVRSVSAIPASSTTVVTFTSAIPDTAYIKKIGDGQNGLAANQFELGTLGSKFDTGATVNATATSTTTKLYVELTSGTWAATIDPSTDSAVIQDYNYLTAGDPSTGAPGGECASVANTIVNLTNVISTILNNGVGTVPRVSYSLNTGTLAQRSTLFTLTELDSNQAPTTNPHQLETGTPVRLVPRAARGKNPDKRLIRLPKGFDTNTTYYVIAPGRRTDPFDYSNSVGFNGANQQTLMLATSEENAAAGIYIYSSETDGIDANVEIDVYQYVLDVKYDLHQYQTRVSAGSSYELETDRPHIFDVPSNNVEPQKVFFRVGTDIIGSSLPTLASNFGGTTISNTQEFFVRYVSSKRFTIHQTFANARDNVSPITFQPGSTAVFYTFASKRRSPLKYDSLESLWYLNTLSSNNEIIARVKQNDFQTRLKTTDSFFERIEDNRTAEDRVYRLRYVIPKNLKTVRDPLRGFVFKIRTDEKRRLLPQKILLKPTAAGASLATFNAPLTGERLGLTLQEQLTLNPNFASTYDPASAGNPKRVETDSKIAFTIQSARKRRIAGKDYLEATVFDIGVDAEAYKTKLFTTVKISAPQGGDGSFVESIPNSNNTNKVSWGGNSKGSAYVHAYFAYENEYYMILKDFAGNSELAWDPNTVTTFTQGSVTATLLDQPNGGRSDISNFLYVVEGANVYTMTPGDTINDDQGVSYTIAEVEDLSEMQNTFYIFDIDTIRRRIPGQQDGVYYLTCLRGNISPYPTGSGVGENFRNFKFSQPVSKLYPEFYKNDPEWYKGIDPSTTTLLDPPPTVSAADNYIHGLVTVNDSKGSVTKEMVLDFVSDPGTGNYTYTNSNAIQAQPGSASAGSEGRLIPISGDSQYPTEGKLYVELRRPSIARSGNHTFEYLGFGPGNYSTGFPARQEVVLTDVQDFYAQAKREDAGIVFYTGLNSNGDLYIGNRKINAITGEETFLEKAEVVESDDEGDAIGTLVTTFDVPVTFNQIITINGGDGDEESTFNAPVVINNATSFGAIENLPSLKIVTGEGTPVGYDQYLEYNIAGQRTGDIILHQNRITAAIFDFNSRGTQDYTWRVGLSNRTPDLANTYGGTTGGPTQLQNTLFGTKAPLKSGDMILKGDQTLFSGSLGWIYANDYIKLTNASGVGNPTPQVVGIQGNASGTLVRLNWNTGITNTNLGITSSTQIRITGATGSLTALNGVWPVYSDTQNPFSASNNFVDILTAANLPIYPINLNSGKGYPVDQVAQPSITIARSQTAFKEWGVIGAEALRTETATMGDYKLGINTVARSAHESYQTAFVSTYTDPKANLDLVGNAYITGQKVINYNTTIGAGKIYQNRDDALIVGYSGDWATLSLNDPVTLRVMTTNGGRLGINTTNNGTSSTDLDRTLVVVGDGRITSNFKIGGQLDLDTGTLNTTSSTFTLATTSTTVSAFSSATSLTIANSATALQNINIGNSATSQNITIGDAAVSSTFNLHRNSQNSIIDIGSVADNAAYTSIVTIGGAYSNSTSLLRLQNRLTRIDGEVEIGAKNPAGSGIARMYSFAGQLDLFSASGGPNTINFARSGSVLSIGADAGTTTVNNTLLVKASETVNGNITLSGGLQAGTVAATRGVFSTPTSAHAIGSLINLNIDLYKPITITKTLDTQGAAFWGGSTFLMAGSSTEYFLPVNEALGVSDVALGDLLLIDRSTVVGGSNQANSEIVRVVEILNATNASDPLGYRVRVQRAQEGTTLRTDHPDNCPIVKLVKSENVSFITAAIGTGAAGTTVNITTSEFGGSINVGDILRIDDTELFRITQVNTAPDDIQGLRITDGGSPAVTTFEVLSTTGNTTIKGTLTVDETITLRGSTTANAALLKVTDGAATPITTFQVDSANGNTQILGNLSVGTGFNKLTVNGTTGNTVINGGDFNIFASDGTTSRLSLVNGTGNLTISGVIATNGTGTNTFAGDVTLNGGDLIVNNGATKRFKVNNNGTIDLGGIDQYFSATGARKWLYLTVTSGDGGTLLSNINYFIKPSANTVVKLPLTATTGDMIRFVDLGGALTYNCKFIVRAPSGVPIQGDGTNTAASISGVVLTGYDGGELIVTTPNAGFGLIYAGSLLSDGSASGIPSSLQGWWLVEI